jgi:tetratricopeptide (TPR) repeat protein
VAVRRGGTEHWEEAQSEQKLHEGDSVRTGPDSRCAILCTDESQIKLNEKTMLILKNVAPSPRLKPEEGRPTAPREPPASRYEVPQGEIWLRNKREKFRFELETPAVTATIRGTEINIQVRPDGATRVVLLEGSICLVNVYGEICLLPGEEGFVLPGQAPTKQMLVQPADAVQWSLYYPGIFSFRDLPLTPQPGQTRAPAGPAAMAGLIQQGESAYDQGRLSEAQQAAESVLAREPGNARALTLLGWVALQKHEPDAALGYFSRVRQTDEMAIVGLALSRYRLAEVAGAYEAMQAAHRLPPNPSLVAMTAFFATVAGRVDQARGALESAVRQYPDAVLPRTLLAQIYLVQNGKDAARREGAAALSRNPNSPLALLTTGLVKMAYFEPTEAARYFDKAINADPRFVDAYVYLARIWLASEYLDRARNVIDKALHLAPKEGTVLSLAGFVRLAFRDYDESKKYFDQATKANARLGEPHLGLAIYQFRYRNFSQGLEEMLTATLLEPRVAHYQNELGKALYQTKSFDRSLEVWDYAKTLDPKDPTPHFYKGVALTDLNRPGEAIQEINKSIELNDNVAIFRGRQSLDQDLSLRNYNLARSYQQLGMQEWAFSKAVTAIKHDPTNSSAHLFLRESYDVGGPFFLNAGEIFSAREVENTLHRLLSPANQNTFSTLPLRGEENLGLSFDYTPMFEMPYARLIASGGVGAWEGKKLIQEHQGWAYGGLPGAAFWAGGFYENDRGYRPVNDFDRLYSLEAWAKYSPTVKGTLSGVIQYVDERTGDTRNLNDFGFSNDPNFRTSARLTVYELGYYHRFNPQVGFLAYYTHRFFPARLSTNIPGLIGVTQTFDREFDDVQFQQHLKLGEHTFIAGFDYFRSNVSQRIYQAGPLIQFLLGVPSLTFDFQPPNRSTSFYLLDYWRLRPNLVVELGLFKDFSKEVFVGSNNTEYNSMWSPRLGANYQFNVNSTQHTLRLALERHLTTHFTAQPLLIPSEIAGFTWALDAFPGAEVRQAGAAWEAQWDPKTFTTLRLNGLRVSNPAFATDAAGVDRNISLKWKRYQASLTLNRILTPSLGLSAGILGKRFVPDLALQFTDDLQDYSEIDGFLGLAYLNRQGWLARVKAFLVQQYLKDRDDSPFGVVNLSIGREFPNKRGVALFEVQNLFNRHFFQALEPRRDPDLFPARQFLFRLALYF